MRNIEKGIEIEENYLQARKEGRDFSLPSALESAGYNNLQEFFEDKKKYQIQNCGLEIVHTTVDQILQQIKINCQRKQPSLLFATTNHPYVWHGSEPYNKKFCMENGIKVHEVGHNGGSIVGSEKDLSIVFIIPKNIDVDYFWILSTYTKIFHSLGIDTHIDNNDLMYNGFKVLGCTNMLDDNMFVNACNISLADSSELIEKICLVKDVKQAGFIPLNATQIIEEVEKWVSN